MVARSPPKQLRKSNLHLTNLRETVKKVDQCMARLQELQHTVRGGKQEPLRMRNTNPRKSPNGNNKLRTIPDEWRRMSLPAMLLGETLGEILQASQFAKIAVQVVSNNTTPPVEDPRTPIIDRRSQPRKNLGTNSNTLQSRRKREKRVALQSLRSENDAQNRQRAKSKINFKASSSPPLNSRERARKGPYAKKVDLYRNPLFRSSPTSKTESPLIARKRQTPHKFLIVSPQPIGKKSQVKHKSPTNLKRSSFSPLRQSLHGNEVAATIMTPHKFRMKIKSPPISIRANKKSPKAISAAGKLRRSLSPARLANRLMSPLRSRKLVHQNEVAMKFAKRSAAFSVKFSPRRI